MKDKVIIKLVKWLMTTFLSLKAKEQLFWFLQNEQFKSSRTASNRAFFGYWLSPLSDSPVDLGIRKLCHYALDDKADLDKVKRIVLYRELARSNKIAKDQRDSFRARVQEYELGVHEIQRYKSE